MNTDMIRKKLLNDLGKELKFKYNGSRNQTEEFTGKIISTYPKIFIIRVNNEEKAIKSFCYSDVLTNSLEIEK